MLADSLVKQWNLQQQHGGNRGRAGQKRLPDGLSMIVSSPSKSRRKAAADSVHAPASEPPKKRGRPRKKDAEDDLVSAQGLAVDGRSAEREKTERRKKATHHRQESVFELYNRVNKPRGRYPRIVDRSIQTDLCMKDIKVVPHSQASSQ